MTTPDLTRVAERERETARARRALGLALALALLTLTPAPSFGRSTGIDSGDLNATVGSCQGPAGLCHSNPATNEVTVSLSGPDPIPPGVPSVFTAMMTGDTQMGAGLQVAAFLNGFLTDRDEGILSIHTDHPQNTRITTLIPNFSFGGQLTHFFANAPPPLGNQGVTSYKFNVTPPANSAGSTIKLMLAMNAFNGDTFVTGEKWNNVEMSVLVPEPGVGALAAAALLSIAARTALDSSSSRYGLLKVP